MLLFLLSATLGFGFLGILPRSINSTFKLLICPAIGLLLFGELGIFYSFVFGVGSISILASLISEAIISGIAFKFWRPELRGEKISIVFTAALLILVVFSSYVYYFQLLHSTSSGSLETGGGGLYGDTALHLAYTSRLQIGEFPPQNPLFAGHVLVYPYANDLLSATLRINGMPINMAFILPQIIFLVAFLTFFYNFTRKFTSDTGFLISLFIFSLGWGVGFVYFIAQKLGGASAGITRDFTNNPDLNLHFHNVFTGLIFPERSFLPGLFITMWIFLNFWEYSQTQNKKFLIINSILVGILPFWHVHTFIFVLISSFVFLVYWLTQTSREMIRDVIILPIVTFLLALPFLILFLGNHSAESFLRLSTGWQNGNENILVFWIKNSFLVIPLAVAGFLKLKADSRIFFIGPFVGFLTANIIIFQPWAWDNIKLLSLSFLFFSVLGGIFLANLFEKGVFAKALVVFVVFVSCLSGLLSIKLQLARTFLIYDKSDRELASWAQRNTARDNVFLVDPIPNHPIPGLAGRLVYLGYPGHLWVHGINYYGRELLNKKILEGNFVLLNETEVPITYVVLPKTTTTDEDQASRIVFENNKYKVLDASK